MKAEKERQVMLAVFDILYERQLITEEERQRLKLLVRMEDNQG